MTEHRIRIHYAIKDEIRISELTAALNAFESRFRAHAEKISEPDKLDVSDLVVRRLETGSITVEVEPVIFLLGSALHSVGHINNVIDFVRHVGDLVRHFSGECPQSAQTTRKEAKDIANITRLAAGNKNGNLGLSVIEYRSNHEETHFRVKFEQQTIQAATEGAKARLEELEWPKGEEREGVLLKWVQTRFSPGKTAGRSTDRAIIESIDNKDYPVFFTNDMRAKKMEMLEEPYSYYFVVDVSVQIADGEVRAYTIRNLHDALPIEG